MLHAPAQPRKGLFVEIQKIRIYGNLWLIDGHFWLKNKKHLRLNNASRASPTPKGIIYGISKKIIHEHLWLIDGHLWLKNIHDYPKREAQIK